AREQNRSRVLKILENDRSQEGSGGIVMSRQNWPSSRPSQLTPESAHAQVSSRPGQIQAAERRRADAPAGRVVDRVGDRGWCRWPRRLAQPTPLRAAGRCEDRLDMRVLVDAEQVVGVEVGVDEATAFELEPASPGMGQLPDDRAFRLLGGSMRIDDATRI